MEAAFANVPLALTMDVGTQSLRGAVYAPDGELLWKKKILVDQYSHPQQGYSEIDPQVYLDAVREIAGNLKQEAPEVQKRVSTISISCMRDCVVPVDSEGKALRPMILWFDERKNETVYPNHPWLVKALSIVGAENLVRENSQASHINWIRDHEPQIWKKTHKILFLSTFIHFDLTGEFADSTSNQTGHICFDSKTQNWSGLTDIKKYVFPVEKEKLCRIVQPGEKIGQLTEKAAREMGMSTQVTVLASASDKACETLGSGCIRDDCAVLSFGSQTTIQALADRYYELERFVPSFPSAIPHRWNSEVQIYRGYWMLSRFLNELNPSLKEHPEQKYALLDTFLKETPAGNDGLVMYPYIGSTPSFPNSSGTFMGLKDYHTKAHLFRALVEGINYTLWMTLEKIERKQKKHIETLILVGGGSANDLIAQITADMFQRRVIRPRCWDSTALGAAVLSYVSMGVFSGYEEALEQMNREADVFLPDPDKKNIYSSIFQEYKKNLKKKIHFSPKKSQ